MNGKYWYLSILIDNWPCSIDTCRYFIISILPITNSGISLASQESEVPVRVMEIADRPKIMDTIVKQTNEEIKMPHQSYHNSTNETEFYTLFGLQYILGVQKASKVNINELWSNRCGITICRTILTEQWFHFLLVCLCFDDKTTRETWLYSDNLAAIWEIWTTFIDNCGRYYHHETWL